jgi:hypothetical protein
MTHLRALPQAVATEEERVKQRKADQQQRKAAAAAAAGGTEQQPPAAAAGGSNSSKPAKKADVDKAPSARPDRVAESSILRSDRAVNRLGKHCPDTFGHLPGIPINHV